MGKDKTFTARARGKQTPWRVRAADVLSRSLITVGGLATILAVSTVFLFLLWVVLPLMTRANIRGESHFQPSDDLGNPVSLAIDDYRLMAWSLLSDGRLTAFRLEDGALLEERDLFPGRTVTASSFALNREDAVIGFSDGSVAFASIGFRTEFLDESDAAEPLTALAVGANTVRDAAMVERISQSQFRLQRLRVETQDPFVGDNTNAVLLTARVNAPDGKIYAAFWGDHTLRAYKLTEQKNILTGEVKYRRRECKIPFEAHEGAGPPRFLVLSGLGDTVLVAWEDGYAVRYNIRNPAAPFVEERLRLLEGGGRGETLTVCQSLLGGATILAGDSSGRVRAWFPTLSEYSGTDRQVTHLTPAHAFPGSRSPVTCLASSARMRIFAAGHEDGTIRIHHVTSHKLLGEVRMPGDRAARRIAFAPKDDGLLALGPGRAATWDFDPRYPEVTLSSLFRPVWYEGAAKPEHVWQSSSATDDFEPKFGLMPLIFGTLKATVFSLLFGVPIALLGAIFTSEFLDPKSRARIKPMVELMASLPSVVLGFLAALVFAPVVGRLLPAFLAVLVTVPLSFLMGAYLWQLLPHTFALRFQRWRFPAMFLAFPLGVGIALALGPVLEQVCFSGDIIRWLDGQIGSARGGWAALLFPVSCILVAWLYAVGADPWLRRISARWPRHLCAIADLAKFLAGLLSAMVIAVILSLLLTWLGFDPRGGIFGTYVQRNALIVGFVMGFAIIPIIYTIAEDALSAVPEHLRSASLAAGATPWQTAVRIIIPTATSGLFSAVMIGLGRAVGETMIVLMAAGNTPLMEWNIFNGFRTLSANIAVELPEAVRNSTHYRTLFLAALVLFVMTFVLNTVAEIVRMRFRKRAFEL